MKVKEPLYVAHKITKDDTIEAGNKILRRGLRKNAIRSTVSHLKG